MSSIATLYRGDVAALSSESGWSVAALDSPVAFPAAPVCELAAGMLPTVPLDAGPEGPQFSVTVSPGAITLRARNLARIERTHVRGQDVRARWSRVTYRCGCSNRRHPEQFEYWNRDLGADGRMVGWTLCHHAEPEPVRRGTSRIREWSPRSRARMVHRVACTDWATLWGQGLPVMVTLTYPGEWESWCPSREVARRHQTAFLKRYQRRWGFRPAGLWKREFQRRGAPHWHWLLPMPRKDGAGEVVTLAGFRAWVAAAWASIVRARRAEVWSEWRDMGMGALDAWDLLTVEAYRHQAVGTAVDMGEGLRMRDPRRMAVYFLKHATPGSGASSKEYQHRVPEAWMRSGGPGRFWGDHGVEVVGIRHGAGRARSEVGVDVRTFVQLRRFLRRWAAGTGRRPMCDSPRLTGGWVLVNDGPGLAALMSRALALLTPSADPVTGSGLHPSVARYRAGQAYAVTCGVWERV